jgi:hypothetical protein
MVQRHEEEEVWDDGDFENGEDAEPTIPCPNCQQEMYEDSPRCPHCGEYVSEESFPAAQKPWWIILGVVLCLIVIAIWIVQMI